MFSPKKISTIYLVTVTTYFYKEKDRVDFKISQEAYSTLEKAQNFCLNRTDAYQIDDFSFCSEPNDTSWHEYQILPITLV